MAGGTVSIPVGTSLLIGVMPSTDGQSLQGLQDRIEKSRHPARLLSAKEPATSLNLLQVAALTGNLAAVKCLLSLGADPSETWQPHARPGNGRDYDETWCIGIMHPVLLHHLGDETLKKGKLEPWPLAGTQLNALHLAAMAGHEDVVRYLVESGALPVDSGPFTPLMAVMTRRCTLSGHSASRMYSSLAYMESKGYVGVMCAHARDGQTSAQCENTYRQKICQPLLGMAQLLIELGADASAAHRTRGCLLAIAASAGKWGLWEQLIRDAPDLASGLAARCHAGRVLLAAMYSYLRDSDQQFLGSVIAFLQSSFAARGQQQRFLQQIRTPLKAAADIPGIATEIHALFGGRVHALCLPLLMGTGQDSADAVQQLLQAGVPVAALKLGRQHYQLACPCSAENVLSIIQHAVAGGDADQCGEILVGLLCQCCPPCDNRILVNAEQMAEALGQLAQAGVDFRQQRWWPRCFGSEYTRMWPMLCQNGVPISPLVFACGTGGMQGAKGMVAALQQMDQQGWAQWVSAPVGPHGDAALLTALYYGHHDILRYLLDARATLTPEQHALVLRCLDHWHEPCAQAAVSEMRAYLDKHIGPCTHCRMYARCRRCARCQKAQYCSRPCQSRAWKAHKQTCMAVH